MADGRKEQLESFASLARSLIDFLLEPPGNSEDAAQSLHEKLAQVYAAALCLPPDGDDYGEPDLDMAFPVCRETLTVVKENVATIFGNDRFYWLQFDPRITTDDSPEPVVGDLADDLGDIYRDIAPALMAWEAGTSRIDDILFEWRGVSFSTHWGVHASQALRVIHKLRS